MDALGTAYTYVALVTITDRMNQRTHKAKDTRPILLEDVVLHLPQHLASHRDIRDPRKQCRHTSDVENGP